MTSSLVAFLAALNAAVDVHRVVHISREASKGER
jgi:hypothetical protein